MSKRKFLVTFATLTIMVSAVSTTDAQSPVPTANNTQFIANGPQEGLSMGPSTRPFATDDSAAAADFFNYDAQLWAPYDIESMDGHTHSQVGFYGIIDFAYLSFSKPGPATGADPRDFNTGNSYHWGRDLAIGFVDDNGAGWGLEWLDLEGVNYVNGEDIAAAQPMLLTTKVDRVALNRQFRQHLSNGDFIDPYIGLYFMSLDDTTIQDVTTVTRFGQRVSNSAFGAHIGSRYVRSRGRWGAEGTWSLFGAYNQQNYRSYVVTSSVQTFANTNEGNDFVPGLDLGFRVAYSLTRDVSFRVGTEISYAWEGFARADTRDININPNAGVGQRPAAISTVDDLIMAGFSFGLDWRR